MATAHPILRALQKILFVANLIAKTNTSHHSPPEEVMVAVESNN